MDRLTFIVEITKALAWPLATVLIIVTFRKSLLGLIPGLRKLRYKDLELQFEEKLEEVTEKAERLPPPPTNEPPSWVYEDPSEWNFENYIQRLAMVSPQVAIIEAWRQLESAIRKVAGKRKAVVPKTNRDLIEYVKRESILPREAISLLEDLRVLRNKAAHTTDLHLSSEQALNIGQIAQKVIASINFD